MGLRTDATKRMRVPENVPYRAIKLATRPSFTRSGINATTSPSCLTGYRFVDGQPHLSHAPPDARRPTRSSPT
ncbi:MAG: hypothetical protein WB020_10160, partial [Candidatus Dormiibacterota bacterium]